MRRLWDLVCFSLFFVALPIGFAQADIDFSKILLGSSKNEVQKLLRGSNFVFHEYNDSQFKGVKLVGRFKDNRELIGKEFQEIAPSTTLSGKFCSGKLYQLNALSHYHGSLNFWQGRKQIYKYINDNKGVVQSIMIGQKPEQSNVGFTFIIDRSASGGKVKGEEIVKVMIDNDTGSMQMRYQFTNKWFCPE